MYIHMCNDVYLCLSNSCNIFTSIDILHIATYLFTYLGSARVCFCNQESYIKALQTRFVLLKTTEINKQVRILTRMHEIVMYIALYVY